MRCAAASSRYDVSGGYLNPNESARTLAKVNEEIGALKEKSKRTESKKKEYEKFHQDKQKLDDLCVLKK